ncbi:MAG: ABC-2 transporter permease [Clostridiales bacterium]|nr:ABC-2 transporter permease [Clostridiales bacterium]
MGGIILTDFYTLKKQLSLCGILGLVYLGIGVANHTAWSMMAFMVLFATILPVNSFSSNDSCRWDVYANTLPVGRKDFVNAKFLLIFILAGCAFLCGVIAVMADNMIHKAPLFEAIIVPFIAGACGLIYASIFVTLIFKFGMERARVFLVAAFLIPALFMFSLPKMGFDLQSFWGVLDKQLLFSVLFTATIVVLGITYGLCRIFYRAKEL